MEEFTCEIDKKNPPITDEVFVHGSKANVDYTHLSANDKTDIMIIVAFIIGAGSLIGSLLLSLFGV